ncbi:MAG: aminotransferase, partial [Trichloromonadaceae bacterium]
ADALQRQLAAGGINTSVVPFSANPIQSQRHPQPPLLRASLHYYNTLEEIERCIESLQRLTRRP